MPHTLSSPGPSSLPATGAAPDVSADADPHALHPVHDPAHEKTSGRARTTPRTYTHMIECHDPATGERLGAVPALTRTVLTSWGRFAGDIGAGRLDARPGSVQKTVDYVDAVLVAFRPVVRPGCLVRGLTLYHFLRRAGADVGLNFGVARIDGRFTGHCWLVKNGRPFLEPDRPDLLYTETFHLPTVGGTRA